MLRLAIESLDISKNNPNISFEDRVTAICNRVKSKPLVIDGTGEGILAVNLINAILNKLQPTVAKIILNVDPKDMFREYEVVVDYTSGVCNWYHWYSHLQSANIDWKNIDINYHFVSLARRPSLDRALYIKDILDLFGNTSLVSFGFNGMIDKPMKDILIPYQLPILIDVNDNLLSSAHCPPNNNILSALFNIVLETNEPNNTEIRITEKGLKPFAWHQIPIFVSGNGYVERMRSLGFDLFDDLLDNNLYNDSHPNSYRLRVMSLCKKLHRKYPTSADLQNLRNQIWDRLVANNRLLSKYVDNDQSGWNVSH
jgi:hypothetical protein